MSSVSRAPLPYSLVRSRTAPGARPGRPGRPRCARAPTHPCPPLTAACCYRPRPGARDRHPRSGRLDHARGEEDHPWARRPELCVRPSGLSAQSPARPTALGANRPPRAPFSHTAARTSWRSRPRTITVRPHPPARLSPRPVLTRRGVPAQPRLRASRPRTSSTTSCRCSCPLSPLRPTASGPPPSRSCSPV